MNTHRTKRVRGNAGLTMIELLLAMTMLAIVLGAVATVGDASKKAYETGTAVSHLESQVAMTMDRIVEDLLIAGRDTLTPDPIQGVGANAVQYVKPIGLVNGAVEWTPVRRLAFEYEDGEIDDGVDNNGNDLVDEGRVVLIEDFGGANERRRVLTRWVAEFLEGEVENGIDDNGNGLVDESGFTVERVGETVVVRLTLAKRNSQGILLDRTARTSTKLRNQLNN